MTFTRVRALIFVAVLFVTAGIVVIMAINKDSQNEATVSSCAEGEIPANLNVPDRDQVTVNIFNGTPRSGLAQQIGDEFKNRGFIVSKMETAAEEKIYEEISVITYGPAAIGAATLVNAYFLGEGVMNFELNRTGAEVDVIIGTKFQQLATFTEVNQSIAQIGKPELEDGTCEL